MSDHAATERATNIPSLGEEPWPMVAREGWPIIAVIAIASVLLGAGAGWLAPVAGAVLGVVGLVVTLWAVWFFRDPERRTPSEPGLVISSADGVVCFVGPGDPPAELGLANSPDARGMTRVSVFMNIFNVHVNRSPAPGKVRAAHYRPGRFFNASLDKASEHNERQSLALEVDGGGLIVVVQIAGLIARRIVCRAKPGTSLRAGERFGLIRFGSRVDVYLPAGVAPLVRIGDRSVAGETVLARLKDAGSGGATRGA